MKAILDFIKAISQLFEELYSWNSKLKLNTPECIILRLILTPNLLCLVLSPSATEEDAKGPQIVSKGPLGPPALCRS